MNPRNLPLELKSAERGLKRLDIFDEETKIPDTDDYYERLHDKIMARVESIEMQPKPRLHKSKDLLKRHWRNGLYLVLMSALATIVGVRSINSLDSQVTGNHAVLKFNNEDQLIQLLQNSPDIMSNTILSSYVNQDLMGEELYTNTDLTKELIDLM